jgi:hypothetical protein
VKKVEKDKLRAYLFMKIPLKDLTEMSGFSVKEIKKLQSKIDMDGDCPLCQGSNYILQSNGQMEWCYCKKYRMRKKYLKPLGEIEKPPKDILDKIKLKKGELFQNICLSGNLSSSQVKYIFSRMLREAGKPRYISLTPQELLGVQFNDRDKYLEYTSRVRIPIILINGSVREIITKYSDEVIIQLISTRANKGLNVWIYLPYNRYNDTFAFCKTNHHIIELRERGYQPYSNEQIEFPQNQNSSDDGRIVK